MNYRRAGKSGLLLSELSLGLWHNFGRDDDFVAARNLILTAFENGITVFDLANNYGPPPGSAEFTFGKIFKSDLSENRNKIVIATKAGHLMWDGPYGDWGSRKHLISSLDESLERLGVSYVDIFYSHRYDPNTPLEETMTALDYIVRSGRAMYVGLSKYPTDKLREAVAMLRSLGTPCVVDQCKYSLLERQPESELFEANAELGLGCVSFSPLAQGQLTDKYAFGIPPESRAAKPDGFLQVEEVHKNIATVGKLQKIAEQRGQTLAQMAIAWQLANINEAKSGVERVSSVIVGASRVEQLLDNIKALENTKFSEAQLNEIDKITLCETNS